MGNHRHFLPPYGLYASSTAIVRNLFSLSSPAGITRENNTNKVIYRRTCSIRKTDSMVDNYKKGKEENEFGKQIIFGSDILFSELQEQIGIGV